jgi:predicted glycoside hydrolase/deacetylase ChbG (UPF0249 family)
MSRFGVIVNADDLGISEAVNHATFELMAKGRISSATIMANGPAVQQAARLSRRFPAYSFGVHLNLTQFEPLTGGSRARLLVDDCGQMSRANERTQPTTERLWAMYEEMCAQIDRVVALGVNVSHLDSHNHIHTRPALFPALKNAQRRYGIRRVRLSKNFYSSDRPCAPGLRWKKDAFNWALKSIYRTRTTEAFTEFLTYWHADPVSRRWVGLIELMVHPGAAGALEETAILDGDGFALAGLHLPLIPYSRLP